MLWNVHSWFSLRYGVFEPQKLPAMLRQRGYDTAALTDINNSAGIFPFIKACRDHNINGLAGIEFRNGDTLCYIGIAADEDGFAQLNAFLTHCNKTGSGFPGDAPVLDHVYWIYPFGKKLPAQLREQEYIGVRHIQLNRIRMERARERYLLWQPVSFCDPEQYKLHRQLRAIDHNLLISQLAPGQYADAKEVFPVKQQLLDAYREFPELIRNTEQLLARCRFGFAFDTVRNKKLFTGDRRQDKELLERMAMEGLVCRYGAGDAAARSRVLRELEVIDKMNFASNFLITDDICRYARHRNFHYVGRGSGANSIIAYCLGITDVCPMELNLYFERFLNPKRTVSLPDFDIDFSWKDRDAVYDYIFRKYGTERTALLGAMSTFRSRSIIRELGKVYGLPKSEIDLMVHDPDSIQNKHEVADMILSVCRQLKDFPNQRTIHASGILISEEPLTRYSALDYPPKGLPTVQYDMYTAEDIGFEKFDILSQRGLGHIRECVQLIRENTGDEVNIHEVKRFMQDRQINDRLRSAQTIGCFYIESPAMRQLISKLQCDNYLTLVAASSIIRPGVAGSGMMKAYIERHRNPGSFRYLHPVLEEQLKETYGIMVYQEDVMKVGHYFGGLDLADADILRRMMNGKYRHSAPLAEIRARFFQHCRSMAYPEGVAEEVWRQIESFAGFSFNKAHSASYAVESYQSLFLKTYYPLEFMVGVINNYGGFYGSKVYFNELRKSGAVLHLPCVNHSGSVTSIKGKDVYVGLDHIRNLEQHFIQFIPEERRLHGPYTGLENLVLRTGIGLEQLVVLIRIGALRAFNPNKKELLWEAHLLLSGARREKPALHLFEGARPAPRLPELETSVVEDLYDEIELIGYPVSGSMFDLVKTSFRGEATAATLDRFGGKVIRILGDFVADKISWTRQGQSMKFGTFFDVNGDCFDTVHFPPSIKKYPLNGAGVYLIEGRVLLDYGVPTIDVDRIGRVSLHKDPRSE